MTSAANWSPSAQPGSCAYRKEHLGLRQAPTWRFLLQLGGGSGKSSTMPGPMPECRHALRQS